jgi:hypothetical protein
MRTPTPSSREPGVTSTTLSSRRDAFLCGSKSAFKSRPAEDRDGLIARPRAKVGQFTMDNELLGQKCRHQEAGRPIAPRMRSG